MTDCATIIKFVECPKCKAEIDALLKICNGEEEFVTVNCPNCKQEITVEVI